MSALIRWLPELAVATAEDIARFGPNAARVRSVLRFMRNMSKEASTAAESAYVRQYGWRDGVAPDPRNFQAQRSILRNTERAGELWNAFHSADHAASRSKNLTRFRGPARDAGRQAVQTEVMSDLVGPDVYRIVTNPLATARAVDVLAPRYQATPFRELLTELRNLNPVAEPNDVLRVGRIAASPDEVIRQEIVDLVKNYGMTLEEAINVVRMV
jgi:hypothetical protein